MRQLTLISLLLFGAVLSEKIPLTKKTLKLQSFKREKALRASGIHYTSDAHPVVGDSIRITDYMNTQYFVDINIGTPK